ncbi:ABC transporter ATP-binding protein [Actinotalea sp. BY-33]|uniref:ABC-type quaternary amine transporter n=1 Tax=Actinotalea soli TaxID=2819234 RepID=A0A939LQZ1_9CELL|nr:ABC transporter ATP-binding protein [Actinotalea soli]MBO1752901.1 ABC transporter ATP-binding protein [Actinotalea soli]
MTPQHPSPTDPSSTTSAGRGLAVRDLVVHYRDDDGTTATAVDGLSLEVEPGEVLGLLGPSGSGKSSLLRAVAGLEPASSGSITWDGADLAGVPVHRRGFGLMFQDGQLFPHRDVAANVAFGLEMAGEPRARRRERVTELLELVGLGGFADRAVSTLSGGERQRVALARSLAPRPRLLLLDEPLSALDRALRERLAAEVREALTTTGTTAVFVTHDHDEAFAVADRIAVMDLGHLLQVARPVDLWHRPASQRVAEFLGYEAFVPAGVLPGVEDDALVALGPGSLRLDPAGDLRGTVRSAGFRRGVVEVVVEVEGIGPVTVVEPSAPDRAVVGPGEQVRLTVDVDAVPRLG